jgi:outer membrane protein assembly factor BamA
MARLFPLKERAMLSERAAWQHRLFSGTGITFVWFLVAGLVAAALPVSGKDKAPKPAEIKVSGYGPLGDLKLKRTLQLLGQPGKKPEILDANFVEDAALVLMSRVERDGHLQPRLTARLTLRDGTQVSYEWLQSIREQPLPRPLAIRKVVFQIHRGVLYYFGKVQINGLSAVPFQRAKAYFVETSSLLNLKATRVYSPDRLQAGISSLIEVLNRRGYENAEVKVGERNQNDRTGQVDITLEVNQGLKSMVRSIREEYFFGGNTNASEVVTVSTNTPFSKFWLQDFAQELRATNYHHGYPDTKVDVSQVRRQTVDDTTEVDLLAQIRSGPQIHLGEVKFSGEKKTKVSVMEHRVHLQEGDLLDRVLVEEARYRLSRLGVFDSVGLTYEPVDETTRNVIYQVKEGKSIDVSLLLGWGSYELLRGGVEVEQNDLFGLAHHARLLLTQSFKASYGEYVYTMPELIGRDIDVFLNASALRREEIDFTREEYGGGFGARKFVKPIESDVTLRYSYQVLNATAPELPFQEGLPSAGVGSVIAEIRHDHVDNPLYPRRGYRLFGNFEIASEYLASDVNYQRLELV